MKELPTVFNVFKKELDLIEDGDIKMFVTDVFGELCPSYFWYIPASVKGHHPPICRTLGGLVHHVKLAVGFADAFLDMQDEGEYTKSQVIAGVLLHDLMKRGENENELDTWVDHRTANRDHGRYCAHIITKYLDNQQWTGPIRYKFLPIINAVKLHMGQWTWELSQEERYELTNNEVVRLTHLADFAASRALHQYLSERAVDETMRYLND